MSATLKSPIQSSDSAVTFAMLRLQAGVAALVKRVRAIWINHRAMSKLVALDDHMLRDIGLTRLDVRMAASLPYQSDPTDRLRLLVVERRAAERVRSQEVLERGVAHSKLLLDNIVQPNKSKDGCDA